MPLSFDQELFNVNLINAYEHVDGGIRSLANLAMIVTEDAEQLEELVDDAMTTLQEIVDGSLILPEPDTVDFSPEDGGPLSNPNETQTTHLANAALEYDPEENRLRFQLEDPEGILAVTDWVDIDEEELLAISIAKALRLLADSLERKARLSVQGDSSV